MCAPSEALCVLSQGGAAEVPKYQVMIRVVHRVPDVHVLEEMAVRTQYVVHPILNLTHHPEYAPHLSVEGPGGLERKKVRPRVLHSYRFQIPRDILIRSNPSGPPRLALKSLDIRILDPWGRFPKAATTRSMVEASLWARHHPTMYHIRCPVSICNLTDLGTN